MQPITIAIVGLGHWGKNYLRVLSTLPDVQIKWICARREETLSAALSAVPLPTPPQTTTEYADLLEDPALNAICIVTPAATHYELAKAALLAGKEVLVEKPFTLSLAEAEELVAIAEEEKRVLMVGHIHCFNPAIQQLKADIASGALGELWEIEAVQRHNDPQRRDAGALWDMLPHPLSIFAELIDGEPEAVAATGDQDEVEVTLTYPSGLAATCRASWRAAGKQFRITLRGQRVAVFDDYAPEKLTYDGVAQHTPGAQPLTAELQHFLGRVRTRREPRTSDVRSLDVMRVLDALERARQAGTPITLTARRMP